jgi:hypothetical protein
VRSDARGTPVSEREHRKGERYSRTDRNLFFRVEWQGTVNTPVIPCLDHSTAFGNWQRLNERPGSSGKERFFEPVPLDRLPPPVLREALINSSLNYQSTPNNRILEKVSFLFCFIFNDLQSLKTAAHPYAAETQGVRREPRRASSEKVAVSTPPLRTGCPSSGPNAMP